MVTTTDRLDRYWADELGCSADALYNSGITTCAPAHRDQPRWMGWLIPFDCIVLDRAEPGTGVISVTPSLANGLERFLQSCDEEILPPTGKALSRFIHTNVPQGYPKVHRILRCSSTTFTPAPDVFPISLLDENDIHASWYRLHFDGPIYVARDQRNSIVSWAAIKCKSDDIWEMAVVTEPHYRGMGLARSVVSHATAAALDEGKVAMYLHEITNIASSKVSQSLGYTHYGHEVTCESGRVMPHR
ncbi:MAG TPA: GNAT family N-acetyltransferase [Armatimonadota bacterium]|nr:GNAT family N-acetyltransferase [Armatimonadota bacterium]